MYTSYCVLLANLDRSCSDMKAFRTAADKLDLNTRAAAAGGVARTTLSPLTTPDSVSTPCMVPMLSVTTACTLRCRRKWTLGFSSECRDKCSPPHPEQELVVCGAWLIQSVHVLLIDELQELVQCVSVSTASVCQSTHSVQDV